VSSESLPTSELSVVDDEVPPVELEASPVVLAVVDVVPWLPPLVIRPVAVPVDPSTEVETDPSIGVVVNTGGASVGAHAISHVLTRLARLAKSRDGEVGGTRPITPHPWCFGKVLAHNLRPRS